MKSWSWLHKVIKDHILHIEKACISLVKIHSGSWYYFLKLFLGIITSIYLEAICTVHFAYITYALYKTAQDNYIPYRWGNKYRDVKQLDNIHSYYVKNAQVGAHARVVIGNQPESWAVSICFLSLVFHEWSLGLLLVLLVFKPAKGTHLPIVIPITREPNTWFKPFTHQKVAPCNSPLLYPLPGMVFPRLYRFSWLTVQLCVSFLLASV